MTSPTEMNRDPRIRASSCETSSSAYTSQSRSRHRTKKSGGRRFVHKRSGKKVRHEDIIPIVQEHSKNRAKHKKSWNDLSYDGLMYALVIAVSIGCYANSLHGEFVHDDLIAVTSNPDVLGRNPIGNLLVNDFWGKPMKESTSHKSYRPLTILTFRMNYFFAGLSPWSYHLANVLLHAAVCVLITYLCLEMLYWPREDCATAALLFASHPIHTEAVSNIVGRAELLSSLFFLVSFMCFNKSTKKPENIARWCLWLISSFIFAGCALLAKEQGIAVLPVCIAWRMLQLAQDSRLTLTRPKLLIKKELYFLSDAIFWTTLTMFVMLVGCRLSMLQGTMPKFSDEDNPASFSPSLFTRFTTYSYLAAFNTWLLLNPTTLSYDWQMGSLPLITTVFDPRNLASLMLFMFLVCLIWRCGRSAFAAATPSKRLESNAFLLSLSVIILPFLPASNLFITVGFVIAERVLYIPSVGFCILVTLGLRKLNANMKRFTWLWRTISIIVITAFFLRTVVRNQDWSSRDALFRSGLKSVPHNAKVHYNFANLQKDIGNVDAAVEHYKFALRLWPSHASAHNNLGTLLPKSEEAEEHFRSALVINPRHPRALFNLASLYNKRGRSEVARELFQRVLELDSQFTEAYSSLANIRAEEGDGLEAEALHIKAINVDPDNADSYNNYGTFLQRFGRMEEAVQQYREAIRLQPNHTVAIVNAARSLRHLKNTREAEKLYKRALSISPEAKIMDNLGVLYINAGRIAEASGLYQELNERYIDFTEGKVHYAQVLMQERSFQHAEYLLNTVVQQNATHRDALHQLSLLYSQINRTTEALNYILKALNLCSLTEINCAQLHVDHGDILKDMKHLDDAAQSYKMAIDLQPKLSHAHVNLAVINHLQGECHQALFHYHEAFLLDPDNPLLLENMRKLKLHLVDDSGTCNEGQSGSCKIR